jgi:hypothetical protein
VRDRDHDIAARTLGFVSTLYLLHPDDGNFCNTPFTCFFFFDALNKVNMNHACFFFRFLLCTVYVRFCNPVRMCVCGAFTGIRFNKGILK